MSFLKRFRRLQESFFDLNDLRWLLGGFFFHTGLASANMPMFVVGVYGFPKEVVSYRRSVVFLSVSSSISIVFHAACYYQAVGQVHHHPLLLTVLISILWIACWFPWSAIYIWLRTQDPYYFSPAIWMFLYAYILEKIDVGFTHIDPMLIGTFWENSIAWLGSISVLLMIWFCHVPRISIIRHGLWCVPLLLNIWIPTVEIPNVPVWLDEIHVFPEGVSEESSNINAVKGKRLYIDNKVYYASIGSGQIEGMSLKRHFVKVVEDGYTPYHYSRILKYKNHKFLLLICNDILYSDVAEEADQADAIVVVSWLEGLNGTPLRYYFMKKLEYIHLKYKKPLRWVDASGQKDYPGLR